MKPQVMVCCFCENWGCGGIESFLCNILCRIDPDKVSVDLVASHLGESVFTEPMRTHGIQFYELSGSTQNILKNHRLFRQLMREKQYDVIHLNLYHGVSLSYAALAKKAGIPIRIVHSHNTALRNSFTKPLKLCAHYLAKEIYAKDATDFWACSSQAAAFLFPRKQAEAFRWIPNGIETEKFCFDPTQREAVRRKLGFADAFVIGHIGRLCQQKNQAFLLEIFAEILQQAPNSRLLLVGSGEAENALKAKAEILQIADKTFFYGISDHPEQLLWAMDVFVLPSLFEGLPVTAVEAQAAGLPCVLSDDITSECKISESVFFCDRTERRSVWANQILTAAQPTGDRSTVARQASSSCFEIKTVSNKIQQFYESFPRR